MNKKVKILIDDPHTAPSFRRYAKGDMGTILEKKTRLAGDRWWHYRVKLDKVTKTDYGTDLSRITYFSKDQVEEL